MVELVYTHDSKSCGASHASSTLALGTHKKTFPEKGRFFVAKVETNLLENWESVEARLERASVLMKQI